MGGQISGSVIEPDLYFSTQVIGAELRGHRNARSVDFTKTYVDARQGYENPVDYVGQLSADGMVVSGVWSLLEMNGAFEMHREERLEEGRSAEEEARAPASGMAF